MRTESGISDDPDWYDPKAAGWWVWGISSWIGHGWCYASDRAVNQANPQVPACRIRRVGMAQGVQMQRTTLPVERDQRDRRPHIQANDGGAGVQLQRETLPVERDQRDRQPQVSEQGGSGRAAAAGAGVPSDRAAQGKRSVLVVAAVLWECSYSAPRCLDGEVMTGERLRPWFRALAQRLSRVIVLNRIVGERRHRQRAAADASKPEAHGSGVHGPAVQDDGRPVHWALRGRHGGQERRRGGCELRVGGGARRPVQGRLRMPRR